MKEIAPYEFFRQFSSLGTKETFFFLENQGNGWVLKILLLSDLNFFRNHIVRDVWFELKNICS